MDDHEAERVAHALLLHQSAKLVIEALQQLQLSWVQGRLQVIADCLVARLVSERILRLGLLERTLGLDTWEDTQSRRQAWSSVSFRAF